MSLWPFFQVDLIGKLIEVRETKGFTQAQLAEAAYIALHMRLLAIDKYIH